MLKCNEINDPSSCLSRAGNDEMVFVLLARDVAAPQTIRDWCARRVAMGRNKLEDPQIVEALACADTMESQRLSGTIPKPMS